MGLWGKPAAAFCAATALIAAAFKAEAVAADPANPAGPDPALSPNGIRSSPKCGSKPGKGGAKGGVGGRLVVTEGWFKPKSVLDDVIFGVLMEDEKDGFEDSRAFEAIKESEII